MYGELIATAGIIASKLHGDEYLTQSEAFDEVLSEIVETIHTMIEQMTNFISAIADDEEGPEPYDPDMN